MFFFFFETENRDGFDSLRPSEEVEPDDEEGILRYLSGGVLRGVGKVTAGRLVAQFGAKTLEVLDSPDAVRRLQSCPGIGAKTAEKIKSSWDGTRGNREAIAFLEQHGLPPAGGRRSFTLLFARIKS